jgi:flavin reductase (DIM6/NTAB) family NADH-FMN oxidoreductase RutF
MSEKTELPVNDLFGLQYWPALPAFLISTMSAEGKPHVSPYSLVFFPSYCNVAEAAETPKVLTFVLGDYDTFAGARESTTYKNVAATGEFVVNIPTANMVEKVDTTVYPADDKYQAAGLTPEPSLKVRTPSVAECPVNYECELLRIEDNRWLGELIFGRIVAVRVDSELPKMPDKDRMKSLSPLLHYAYGHFNGTYYGLGDALLEETEEEH